MCFLPEIAKDISPASDQGIQVAKRKRWKMLCFLWLVGCIGIRDKWKQIKLSVLLFLNKSYWGVRALRFLVMKIIPRGHYTG